MKPWPHFSLTSNAWSSTFLRSPGPTDLDAAVDALEFQWHANAAPHELTGGAQSGPEIGHRLVLNADPASSEIQITHQLNNKSAQEIEGLAGAGVTLSPEWAAPDAYLECGATGMFSTEEDPPLRRKWPKGALETADPRRFTGGAFKRVFLTDFDTGLARWVVPLRKQAIELTWDALVFPYLWFEQSGTGSDAVVRLRAFSGLATALHDGHGLLAAPSGQLVTLTFKLSLVAL